MSTSSRSGKRQRWNQSPATPYPPQGQRPPQSNSRREFSSSSGITHSTISHHQGDLPQQSQAHGNQSYEVPITSTPYEPLGLYSAQSSLYYHSASPTSHSGVNTFSSGQPNYGNDAQSVASFQSETSGYQQRCMEGNPLHTPSTVYPGSVQSYALPPAPIENEVPHPPVRHYDGDQQASHDPMLPPATNYMMAEMAWLNSDVEYNSTMEPAHFMEAVMDDDPVAPGVQLGNAEECDGQKSGAYKCFLYPDYGCETTRRHATFLNTSQLLRHHNAHGFKKIFPVIVDCGRCFTVFFSSSLELGYGSSSEMKLQLQKRASIPKILYARLTNENSALLRLAKHLEQCRERPENSYCWGHYLLEWCKEFNFVVPSGKNFVATLSSHPGNNDASVVRDMKRNIDEYINTHWRDVGNARVPKPFRPHEAVELTLCLHKSA